jgi:NADH:ubiquinone oxidoreductase subunit H
MLFTYFASAYLVIAYLLIFFSIVTLWFERKFIAIAQKRLGVSFLGRNGWVHLPADMVKFWLKYTGRNVGTWLTNSAGFLIILVGFFV